MFAVGIELLTGRYAASRFDNRKAPEWPPHPARLFSAMVAAWADADAPDPDERRALLWLESQGAPELSASPAHDRSPIVFYVPNNEAASSVVTDLSGAYQKLTEFESALIAAQETGLPKVIERAEKALAKHQSKIRTDSARGAAAKVSETMSAIGSGLQLLPDNRGRQARHFPTCIPIDPVVQFSWPSAQATAGFVSTIDGLLARIARLGHSSSMVSCGVVHDPRAPTLRPGDHGKLQVRVLAPGLLEELEIAFTAHQGIEPRVLPNLLQGYVPVADEGDTVSESVFGGNWTALRLDGAALPLISSMALATAVRGAVLHHAVDPIPAMLTGHQPGASNTPPAEVAHLAVVPLPFVGHAHADGGVRGVALILPSSATPADLQSLATALDRWTSGRSDGTGDLTIGRAGRRAVAVAAPADTAAMLRSSTWSGPSADWASVTPVALDRFPKGLLHDDPERRETAEEAIAATIARSCLHVGLPEPVAVQVSRQPLVRGSSPIGQFPVYRSPGRKTPRASLHVRVQFAERIRGPVIIGAGRYFGQGLLWPIPTSESAGMVSGHGAVSE